MLIIIQVKYIRNIIFERKRMCNRNTWYPDICPPDVCPPPLPDTCPPEKY